MNFVGHDSVVLGLGSVLQEICILIHKTWFLEKKAAAMLRGGEKKAE